MIEIKGLTFEENKKYQTSISQGYFDGYEENPRKWKHTFVGAYVWKYPMRTSVMNVFRDMLGHVPTWEDITDTNLKDLRDELAKTMCNNTLHNRFAELKAVINDNVNEVEIPTKRFSKILKAKEEPPQNIYLSEEEIEKIHNYVPTTNNEQYVRKIFMIEALTGARNCDSVRMNRSHVHEDIDSVRYVSQKVKGEIVLPVHRYLMSYLADPIHASMVLSTFNDTLRTICRRCGINEVITLFTKGQWLTQEKWQFVSSHTGRRCFATNLFIRGADPSLIARYMGHSSPEITIKRYIVGYRQADETVLKFFK